MRDLDHVYRAVCGFSKIPDEDGEQIIQVKYRLATIDLSFLRKLFNINVDTDPDPWLFLCYEINPSQAKALQPYVINGKINLDEYDFMLECYAKDPYWRP